MQASSSVQCSEFPCQDVRHASYCVPEVDLRPEEISILMISECTSVKPKDFYYAGANALFAQTTVQAFNDAGAKVASIEEILALGVYLTPAVKCAKIDYAITTRTVEACSHLLQRELALFPNVKAYLLMGDVAIKAFNHIAKRTGQGRVIPVGSTYKLRGQEYSFHGRRVFPSYLQAGPSFFIEKSKRKMIAEDIASALRLLA